MADKKSTWKTQIGLLISTEHTSDYFHVRATPVSIGKTLWEAQWMDTHPDSTDYRDIAYDTIRNPTSRDLYNGLRLGDLEVYSQGNNNDQTRHLYGWEICYRSPLSIELRDAKQMYKTLQTISTKMDKLTEKYGRPATFGAYVARVAAGIGADKIVFLDTPNPVGWHHRDNYRLCTLADGISRIDNGIVRQWIETDQPQSANLAVR